MEDKILESLSPIEKKVLPHISENTSLIQISEKSKTDQTTAMRALEFLKNKGIVEIKITENKQVSLGINGIYYQKKGLPERRLLNALLEKKSIPLGEVGNVAELNENEAKVSVGTLKKKALADIKEGRVILTASEAEVKKESLEEKFLKRLPTSLESLEPEEKLALENLKQRKDIIELKLEREVLASLTAEGKKVSLKDIPEDMIEQLTPKIISSEGWKGKKFRRYDIKSPVPRLHGGKRHFVNQATDYARRIWLDMGFKEMSGNMAVSGFWNFDALFTPQDHPARELQDTFFLKTQAKLPDKKLVDAVKASHAGTLSKDSKGWQYEWQEAPAKKVLLRTHTTALSSQTLKKIAENKEYPAKYFALGKCFRNETVDWSHGFEFDQTEGIVIDENATLRQLMGYLVQFYKKMGYEKVRIRPHYFPYTEPSMEIDAWNTQLKRWVEIGGAGIFRPEVTTQFFGRHIPVLAWGPGFSRIIMEYFGITDLREMHKNNITKLRETKFSDKMSECIFCKIVKGEIPCVKIWEDNDHIAILDIAPLAEGMTVVIPKRHMESYVFDIPKTDYKDLMLAAKKAGKFLDRGLRADRILMVVEGLEVDHAHVKLYPMVKGSGFTGLGLKCGENKSEEELNKVKQKILENNK